MRREANRRGFSVARRRIIPGDGGSGRLKNSGMYWTVSGAHAILALRCCALSGTYQDFWAERPSAQTEFRT
ncbi:MAG: hypothetical protein OXC19_08145 [Bryobacterales bacterium]|nr:hypothetical protein [Bryobacterales bacterium]